MGAVVLEQLEGVGGDGNISDPQDMHLGGNGGRVPLRLVAVHGALVPRYTAGGVVLSLEGLDFLDRFHGFRVGHFARGQHQVHHFVGEGDLPLDVAAGQLADFEDLARNPASDVLGARQPAQFEHALLSGLAVEPVGGEIAGRPGPAEYAEFGPGGGAQPFANIVPEIGVNRGLAFHHLRGAGDVNAGRQELLFRRPKEQQFQAVVRAALDAAEFGRAGGTVHLGGAVGIDGAAVVAHHGLPQPPAYAARLSLVPGAHADVHQPRHEEFHVFPGRHYPLLRNIVFPFFGHRPGVGVRGGQDQFARIEVGQLGAQAFAHPRRDERAERHEIGGEQDGLVGRAIARARLEGHRCGGDRVVHAPRDAQVELPVESHGLVRGDADASRADAQLGSAAVHRDGRRQDQHGGLRGLPPGCAGGRRGVVGRMNCSSHKSSNPGPSIGADAVELHVGRGRIHHGNVDVRKCTHA